MTSEADQFDSMFVGKKEYPPELQEALVYRPCQFVESCKTFFDEKGFLTPKQIEALKYIDETFFDEKRFLTPKQIEALKYIDDNEEDNAFFDAWDGPND